MKKKRLGVNIDHVATIRNARGEKYPDPLRAALLVEKNGADSITVHLREDKRHIKEIDLKSIIKKIKIPVNLEIAPTKAMEKIALKYKPNYVCIVPEKRKEITTEGGLNLKKNIKKLKKIISSLKEKNIRTTLFINPNVSDVFLSKKLGANCVELHTGKYCNSVIVGRNIKKSFLNIKKSAYAGKKLGLEVHAGHGLTYNTVLQISKIKYISEFNIGHYIIAESIFFGLKAVVKKFKKIINK